MGDDRKNKDWQAAYIKRNNLLKIDLPADLIREAEQLAIQIDPEKCTQASRKFRVETVIKEAILNFKSKQNLKSSLDLGASADIPLSDIVPVTHEDIQAIYSQNCPEIAEFLAYDQTDEEIQAVAFDEARHIEQLRQKKYRWKLIQEEKLYELFNKLYCHCGSTVSAILPRELNGCLHLDIRCNKCNDHSFQWSSSSVNPTTKIPDIAMALSSSFFLIGLGYTELKSLQQLLQFAPVSKTHFYDYNKATIGAIHSRWQQQVRTMLERVSINDLNIVVVADGTWDSSRDGKYCVVSFMNYKTKELLHLEVVTREEAGSSVAAETMAFRLGLDFLQEMGVPVTEIVYDCHKSIPKIIQTEYPELILSHDLWHYCKSIKTKIKTEIDKLDTKKNEATFIEMEDKKRAMVNHVYYAARHSDADYQKFYNIIMNLPKHLKNEHEKCAKYNPNATCVQQNWSQNPDLAPFKPLHGSSAIELTKKITQKVLLGKPNKHGEDIQPQLLQADRLSRNRYSAWTESFNHAALKYKSKYKFYHLESFLARTELSGMDWQSRHDPDRFRFRWELMVDVLEATINDTTPSITHARTPTKPRPIVILEDEVLNKKMRYDQIDTTLLPPVTKPVKKKQSEKKDKIGADKDNARAETPKKRRKSEDEPDQNPNPKKKSKNTTSPEIKKKLEEVYHVNPHPSKDIDIPQLIEAIKQLGEIWEKNRILTWFNNKRQAERKKSKDVNSSVQQYQGPLVGSQLVA